MHQTDPQGLQGPQADPQTGWAKYFGFLEDCNRFYLAILFVCSLYFFMPMIAMSAVLVSQISYRVMLGILAELSRILSAPWQGKRFAQAFIALMTFMKVFWANIGFLSAVLPAADKHESHFQKVSCQRGKLKSTPLFYLDTVIKITTSVSAILYGKLLFQASSWYVPSIWLYMCGFGVAMQGFLGLRLMLYEAIDKLKSVYSRTKYEPDENLNFFDRMINKLARQSEHWQKSQVSTLLSHAASEYVVMVVASGMIACIFPYSVVFPGWYLLVSISCAMRLFKNIIQDGMRVIAQLWQVVWHQRYWENGEYKKKTLAQGLHHWVKNCLFKELSVASIFRAALSYFSLLHFASMNPVGIIGSLSGPAWIAIKVILRGGLGVVTFILPYTIPMTVVAVLYRLDSKGDGIDKASDELIFNMLCKIFYIDHNSSLKGKVKRIYISFMQSVVYMLILSILYPVVPGLWPINAVQKASASFMKQVVSMAWYLFSLVLAKVAIDVLGLNIAIQLRKLHEPPQLCDAVEKSVGWAGLFAHFYAKFVVTPSRFSQAIAAIVSPIFRYTGMSALWSFLQTMAKMLGITYLLSMAMNAMETWRVLAPLKTLLHMLGAVTLDQWGVFLVASFGVTVGMILWDRVTIKAKNAFVEYRKIVEENKAIIDVILNVIVVIALCAFLISFVIGVTKIAICLSAGMSWQASMFSLLGHLLSTGVIAYLAGYVIPMQIQNIEKSEDKKAEQNAPVTSDRVRRRVVDGRLVDFSENSPAQSGHEDPAPSAPPLQQDQSAQSDHEDPAPSAPPLLQDQSVDEGQSEQSASPPPWGYGLDPQNMSSGF